ncbi:hypothetical protein [Peribacillus butanolivorans]|uniref:hypothetical protein n=1 Tax=Peribacillus butanolivorans TaxID=421767 RepID=UPI0036472B23
MVKKVKKFKLWIPLLLLFINIILISFLIEELIDASPPNHGDLAFSTPIIGLISFAYIRKSTDKNYMLLIWILQGINWLFLVFPIAVIAFFMLAFI